MARNRKKKGQGWFDDNYWQSDNFNQRTFAANLATLAIIASNRFRWVGLPDSCDARFLEYCLVKDGIATICEQDGIWYTLQAVPQGEWNAYGVPVRWRARGWSNSLDFECTPENGILVYGSNARIPLWNTLNLRARRMTHYERTEDVNLYHQQHPMIITGPKEKQLELENIYKQVAGFETAIIGTPDLGSLTTQISAINTEVPYVGEELAQGYQNQLNRALMYLGVPHLAFEKGERMIEQEARANTAATEIMRLDGLQPRRAACVELERFGLNVSCYYNEDLESLNYNYGNNSEAKAQDGIGGGVGDGLSE